MNKLESLKLFKDLNEVSNKYQYLNIENNKLEVENNKALQETIYKYKSDINKIKSRANFISKQTREQAKSSSSKEIYSTILQLNNFAKDSLTKVSSYEFNIKSICIKSVLLTTVNELMLINNSIRNKEFLSDKNLYFYIYEKITINALLNFLVLKDINLDSKVITILSQAILSQIQTLSLISL
ncbi:MAG: hypothetical protein E6X43_04735 [Peptostreptococcaceae bacterium]|nr:hypothetical protein [Peptostreptococcaceae bacterium]